MLLTRLVTTSADVGATRSRLAKRALLADCIKEAAASGPAEVELTVTYLSGTLRQRRTGVGWASMSALPPPAATPTLTVDEVDAAFEAVAAIGGGGSAALRAGAVEALFARATADEQSFLQRLVFEELRQGALDSLVQDGLAAAFDAPTATVQRAAMLLGSTPAAAGLLAAKGIDAVAGVGLRVGVPVRPMLAASAPDPEAAVPKSGLPALVDAKLDGIRVQVHRDGERVRLYTRSLDDITDRLPDVVDAVLALAVTRVVLDGEVVGLGAGGRPLPFQVIASRTASSVDVSTARTQTPLQLFVFDLLHVDGRDLLDEPLAVRADVMTQVLPPAMLVPRMTADTAADITAFFTAVVADGFEGVVVKNVTAPYAAGRRDSGWIKLKPRHTFDLAVIAAEWGYGRREGWLSNLHLAARGPDGELIMLGKTFKGLTDKMLTWQTEQFLARETRRTKSTVHVDPPLVAEIAIDGIQRSTRYPGGIALRFARVLRYRDDKSVDEVDTLKSVVALGATAGEGVESAAALAEEPVSQQVSIRLGQSEDAADVAEVYLAAVRSELPYLQMAHTDDEVRAYFRDQVLPRTRVLVAVRGGEVVGFGAHADGELDHLYVRPDVLRQGVGTAVIQQIKRESPNGLGLWAFQRNWAARSFYRRHGFVLTAMTDGSRNEEREPDLRMSWPPPA